MIASLALALLLQAAPVPSDIANWSGWGYLKKPPAVFLSRFVSRLPQEGPLVKPGPFRMKVILLRNASTASKDAQGVYRLGRKSIDDAERDQIFAEVKLLEGDHSNLVGGAKYELAQDFSTNYWKDPTDKSIEQWLTETFEGRLNGPGFEPDDKIFRGPYSTILVLSPAMSGPDDISVLVDRTPVTYKRIGGNPDGVTPGAYASLLWSRFSRAYTTTRGSWKSPNVEVSLQTDPDRGPVLKYIEKGLYRSGGLVLPAEGHIDPAKTPSFSFWARSSSKDSISLKFSDYQREIDVSIGADPGTAYQLDRPVDGAWRHYEVDLTKLGLSTINEIILGPSKAALAADRRQVQPIEGLFSDFRLNEKLEAPTPAPAIDPKIAALQKYISGGLAEDKAAAVALLTDLNDENRLTATIALGDKPDPSLEGAFAANVINLEPMIGAASLDALAKINTASSWEVVRRGLFGPNDAVRAEAARLLSAKKDPSLAGPIAVLISNRDWQVRRAGAQAIAALPGQDAALILMTFLQDEEPSVRLAATQGADATIESVCKGLLYSSVNDPSDLVRAWSDIKLIGSPIARFAAEGYKGVRDDGKLTRTTLLNWMATHPAAGHRSALRIAANDSDIEVRIAAIMAFATLPGDVTVEELGAAAKDSDPRMVSALQYLASKKGISIPETKALE